MKSAMRGEVVGRVNGKLTSIMKMYVSTLEGEQITVGLMYNAHQNHHHDNTHNRIIRSVKKINSPANSFSYILVDLSEFGLQVLQQSVQKLGYAPLLLGQPSLKHVQATRKEKR